MWPGPGCLLCSVQKNLKNEKQYHNIFFLIAKNLQKSSKFIISFLLQSDNNKYIIKKRKMKSALLRLCKKLTSPEIPLEKRITYAMVIFAMLGALFGFIESFLLNYRLQQFFCLLFPFSFCFFCLFGA